MEIVAAPKPNTQIAGPPLPQPHIIAQTNRFALPRRELNEKDHRPSSENEISHVKCCHSRDWPQSAVHCRRPSARRRFIISSHMTLDLLAAQEPGFGNAGAAQRPPPIVHQRITDTSWPDALMTNLRALQSWRGSIRSAPQYFAAARFGMGGGRARLQISRTRLCSRRGVGYDKRREASGLGVRCRWAILASAPPSPPTAPRVGLTGDPIFFCSAISGRLEAGAPGCR